MAKVTITIEDTEDGRIAAVLDCPVEHRGESEHQLTPAETMGFTLLAALEAFRQQQESEKQAPPT